MIDDYVAGHPEARAYASLGQIRYLSCIAQVDAVVGNSSSGLYEVPSFKKPTVNIGDRQKGRIQASSVINCRPEAADIARAISKAFATRIVPTPSTPTGTETAPERSLQPFERYGDYTVLSRNDFSISDHEQDKNRIYIIAEAGVNHNGSLDLAKRSSMLPPRPVPMR